MTSLFPVLACICLETHSFTVCEKTQQHSFIFTVLIAGVNTGCVPVGILGEVGNFAMH